MTSDGSPWRPLVHGLDIGKAIRCVLEPPREVVDDQVFNVGSDAQNYQVRDIAERVATAFPGCTTSFGPPSADNRSYRVDFSKISGAAAFLVDRNADRGARQLADLFDVIALDRALHRPRSHPAQAAPAPAGHRTAGQSAVLDRRLGQTGPSERGR